MAVLFDNNVLCLLLHPDANVPNDPQTQMPIERAAERVRYLTDTLHEQGVMVVIPTPVLAEFLTFAAPEYLAVMRQSIWFEFADFDQAAAIEAAVALRRDIAPGGGGKKLGLTDVTWQDIKVDRYIIAIAKARGVTAIYSTDKGVLTFAKANNLAAFHVADLPLPPPEQQEMTLEDLIPTSPQASSAPEPPSAPTGGVAPLSTSAPAPVPREDHHDAPGPRPPDSSPGAPPLPPSKK